MPYYLCDTFGVVMQERVVVVGHGAREHALAYKLSQVSSSGNLRRDIIVLGGNAGIAQEFECKALTHDGHNEIIEFCRRLAPDLIVIGPELYLDRGLVDGLQGLPVFGPQKAAAKLESSKAFTKRICQKAGVLTAASHVVKSLKEAQLCIENNPRDELVVKVDGLCAGKGVFVCKTKACALETVTHLFHEGFSRLGVSDQTLIIEEHLSGHEVSVFGAAFGANAVLFNPMQDYKRLKDANWGPNTGGMGSVGPLGQNIDERQYFLEKVKEQIFLPVLKTMTQEGTSFFGLLYAGLMLVEGKTYLLEFNVRFGDPETQALLFGMKADIFPLLKSIANRETIDHNSWQSELLSMRPTVAVVAASKNYPEEVSNPCTLSLPTNQFGCSKIFFAATSCNLGGHLMAGSGRVLSSVASGSDVNEARNSAYDLMRGVNFAGMQYRHDIGLNLTSLNASARVDRG
jgi:phosphoribosylamine--glycine ligase